MPFNFLWVISASLKTQGKGECAQITVDLKDDS